MEKNRFNFPQILHNYVLDLILMQYSGQESVKKKNVEDTIR